jgi:hypothetical protein
MFHRPCVSSNTTVVASTARSMLCSKCRRSSSLCSPLEHQGGCLAMSSRCRALCPMQLQGW